MTAIKLNNNLVKLKFIKQKIQFCLRQSDFTVSTIHFTPSTQPTTIDDCTKDGGEEFFHWGGGSSIVKVPGDVPPTRVYFFGPLV